jgi:hypothetical protein
MIMATAHSMSKARWGRNRSSKWAAGAPGRKRRDKQNQEESKSSVGGNGTRIRGRFREFLQSEQGFLLKMQSLLLCIAQSMDDSAHPSTGPYYPDVVELAAELSRRRAANIDDLLLAGRLPAAKRVEDSHGQYASLSVSEWGLI